MQKKGKQVGTCGENCLGMDLRIAVFKAWAKKPVIFTVTASSHDTGFDVIMMTEAYCWLQIEPNLTDRVLNNLLPPE